MQFSDLGSGFNIADLNAGNAGTESYQTYYWDKPGEFHAAVSGYLPVVGGTPTGLKYHAVETSTQWHLISPFFYQVWNKTPSLAISSFTSKIKSYGVKSFYLSVPECFSTPLANIPSRIGGNWVTLGTFANLTTQLNALGGETVSGYTYRDYYLMGLRDMAFAAARPEEAQDAIANGGMRAVDAKVRLLKGVVLAAEYSGLGNVDFNRYEEGAVASVLWKIPRQIIYYNKLALAFGNKDTAAFNTSSSFSIKNEIRFQGYQSYQDTPTYSAGFVDTNNTIAGIGRGTLFKAEEYWSDWNQKWAGLSDVVPNYRFNQADIDWFMYNIQDGTAPNVYPSNIGLYKINAKIPPHTIYIAGSTSFGNGHETTQPAAYIFPF